MTHSFWAERWSARQIGFHGAKVHPALVRHAEALGIGQDERILVPLCGKSLDLLALAQAGATVVGVEFVAAAVEEFFAENHIALERDGVRYEAVPGQECGRLSLVTGDFLSFDARLWAPFTRVYDRAALVALPRDMRKAYARRITELTAPGARQLLVSFDYDSSRMDGPPYAVPTSEVLELYEDAWQIERLESEPPEDAARFQERGASWLNEEVYLLTRL